MRLFRRRRTEPGTAADVDAAPPDPRTPWPEQPVPADVADAATTFWEGWYELLPEVSAALGDREPNRVEHDLCTLVEALHPRLHFSLERGRQAIYALVLSGQEDPELRPYTDAWKAAAPPDDAIWEYHDSVPPVPDPTEVTVNLGEHQISLAEIRVVAQVNDDVVDVAVHHPVFADLDEAARTAMTFLPLDATLGERVAAERLRRVETAETEPEGTIGLLEFRELVRTLPERPDESVGASD
ncbi:hypothetical protein GCM10022222_70610 [Amycolatopsis ultiminotia]|uniref:Uncharacterized protein n=1 Tax=Amycolatopsis ultiminotia TaxID=543629 RepID=A0ABP6Y160_9PSEU